MKNKNVIKEFLYCVGAFICMLGTIVMVNTYTKKCKELELVRNAYKEEYQITRQIDYIENLYIDDNGTLIVK